MSKQPIRMTVNCVEVILCYLFFVTVLEFCLKNIKDCRILLIHDNNCNDYLYFLVFTL